MDQTAISQIGAEQIQKPLSYKQLTAPKELNTKDSFAQHLDKASGADNTRKTIQNSRMAGGMPVWKAENYNHGTSFAPSDPLFATEDQNAAAAHNNDEELGLGDLIDVVNPLHHVPLVGTLYREVTGDEIKPAAQMMGGGIFGGPIGMASAMANIVIEDQTGQDAGEHVMAAASGKKSRFAKETHQQYSQIEPASGGHASPTPASKSVDFVAMNDARQQSSMGYSESKAYQNAQSQMMESAINAPSNQATRAPVTQLSFE